MSKILSTQDLAALFDAFNRHDVDGVMAYISPDCVFDAVAGSDAHGRRFDAPEAIAAAFSGVWAAMPDANWAQKGHFIADDRAVSEWLFTGTQSDGQRIEAEGADIFTHKDGLITRKQAFRKQRPLLPAQN
ncbi:nuclear transport factor 2 family protein [Devosia ureilytica]|uniref:nuclear transport factor 2 family protein n=1 Tax=Devosia ureilytica TaxID=2952754 RepID=UPI0022B271D1|nr:nuclear transport factor 2 family protein [Devosia ureilytica]